MPRMLLLAALMISVAPAAVAQSERERGDRACRGDAVRLCKKVLDQGDFVVLSCFQQNVRRLSKGCHAFLVEMGQIAASSSR